MRAIMYHYVRESNDNFPNFRYLDINNFRKQLDYFQREFGFVTKEEFREYIESGDMPSKNGKIILTFDDGISDHYNYVLEELTKRDLWGFFFISTDPLIKKSFLDVHLIHLLCGKCDGTLLINKLNKLIDQQMINEKYIDRFDDKIYLDQSNEVSVTNFKKILNYFIKANHKKYLIDQMIKDFMINITSEKFYLNESQIKEMHDYGMYFGSHTKSHTLLSTLDYNQQFEEIRTSTLYIEELLNTKERYFCFPYGGFHSFDKNTITILKDLKFDCSFNVEKRQITKNDINFPAKYSLPRYDCNQYQFGKTS